jgi:hypothetical protein
MNGYAGAPIGNAVAILAIVLMAWLWSGWMESASNRLVERTGGRG